MPVKQCPKCGSMVAIKTKRPVYSTRKSKRITMQQQRALESVDGLPLRLVKESTKEPWKPVMKLCIGKSRMKHVKPKGKN
jgi:hypothetical protein